ncbi:MAG: TolC family protein [Bacteroidales bacterium]|jgi:outer membrane protein TolC|nr:TolC family protein [Bacteroidales bacterium]
MKIRFKQIVFCTVTAGMGFAAYAQEQQIAQTPPQQQATVLQFTLKEAQEHALLHNKNIRNAGLAVSEAQKKVWESISTGLPQADATLDYQNMMGFKMSLFGQSIPLEPTSTLQVRVTQLLFNGSYWIGIKMAKIGEKISETMQLQSELDVKQQTRSAYLSILVALENKTILEKSLADIETLAKSTSDMVKIGVAEQTDADQLVVQVASVMNNIKMVERAVELAYNLLRFHLGVDINTTIVLKEKLDDLINENSAQDILGTTFDPENNYNIQLLDGQTELARKQVQLEQVATLPTVGMFYNYTYKLKASTFDMSPNNVIGLQASIPIFASGRRHSKIQQAKIKVETAQNNKELATEQLLLQEKQLRFNLNNALETLHLQKETLAVSQRVLESITRKYRQGISSSFDVTTANTSLLQAQGNYISAVNSVITAQTELEKLLNTL